MTILYFLRKFWYGSISEKSAKYGQILRTNPAGVNLHSISNVWVQERGLTYYMQIYIQMIKHSKNILKYQIFQEYSIYEKTPNQSFKLLRPPYKLVVASR